MLDISTIPKDLVTPANVRMASGEPNLLFSMPVRGIWLGLSSGISLSDALGITFSGGLLAPGKTQGEFREDGAVQVALNSNLDSEPPVGIS